MEAAKNPETRILRCAQNDNPLKLECEHFEILAEFGTEIAPIEGEFYGGL